MLYGLDFRDWMDLEKSPAQAKRVNPSVVASTARAEPRDG